MDWKQQLQTIKRGVADVITEEELVTKLRRDTPLRIKYGIDPTSPHVHLGHTVPIRKLRQFQDMGHQAVLIIGDYTAQIGDPSEKDRSRPQLTRRQVEENAQTYLEQIGQILDISKTEVVNNAHWFSKLAFDDALRLAGKLTINRALERDAFEKRFKAESPIYLRELMYCLMQGYDSVIVRADVELGGTDQTYNLLVGRDLQRDAQMPPQVCITLPILVGTDGKMRMGKSLGNYIGVSEDPKEMFGKIMSIPDDVMPNYFELLTDIPKEESDQLLAEGNNPRDAKFRLAQDIVAQFHGEDQAVKAKEEFIRVFSKGRLPKIIPEALPDPQWEGEEGGYTVPIVNLLTFCKLATSNSEARRLVTQGGVKIDGGPITDPQAEVEIQDGTIAQVGKRRFIKFKLPP